MQLRPLEVWIVDTYSYNHKRKKKYFTKFLHLLYVITLYFIYMCRDIRCIYFSQWRYVAEPNWLLAIIKRWLSVSTNNARNGFDYAIGIKWKFLFLFLFCICNNLKICAKTRSIILHASHLCVNAFFFLYFLS